MKKSFVLSMPDLHVEVEMTNALKKAVANVIRDSQSEGERITEEEAISQAIAFYLTIQFKWPSGFDVEFYDYPCEEIEAHEVPGETPTVEDVTEKATTKKPRAKATKPVKAKNVIVASRLFAEKAVAKPQPKS